MASDTVQNPDDERILKYAGELFHPFGITKPDPDTVVWDDNMDPDRVIVQLGEAKLPRSMMGRLTAEEWKPLLAPAIILGYFLLPRQPRDTILRLVLPLGIGEVPLTVALLKTLPLGRQDPALSISLLFATIIIWASYALLMVALWSRRAWRGLFYTADGQAADKLGREVLLATLTKYGETISVTGYPRKRLHLWPTVSQRIERLQRSR
ncbi:MAG: hypothetical protein AUI97_08915 [Crenarchaeota archaeon 13_1_40CM_3_52_17]|nr:MAG: hypothetical protein AUI97_08915 [Crenarchaeota archaeon 13_1_40CM_3_52_17]